MTVYNPYPSRNRALVKALYRTLKSGAIDRVVWAACMQIVMGAHRAN